MWRRRIASTVIRNARPSYSSSSTLLYPSTYLKPFSRAYHGAPLPSSSWFKSGTFLTITGSIVASLVAYKTIKSTLYADVPKKPGGNQLSSTDPRYNTRSINSVESIAIGLATLAVISFCVYATTRYRRCPANQILVIQGKVLGSRSKSAKCMHGGGAFVWPIFQEYAYMSLRPIQIEAPLKSALSSENIRVNVPSVFTIGISTDENLMENAAKRLLGLDQKQIAHQAQEIIFGQLRKVIAGMKIEEINKSREKFVLEVATSIDLELNKIGLSLINVNITDITDESDYLASIGRKASQEAVQKARVDVSEQEKLGEVGVAANRKEAALKIAELKKDQTVGESQASFESTSLVASSNKEMRVKVASYNSSAIAGENEANSIIAESNAQLNMRRAAAFRESESKVKEAEAYVREAQARAEAKTALAEAEKIEVEKRAELVAPAIAQKAEVLVRAEAESERVKVIARAEAESTYVKMEAQARGDFELLSKKAQGLKLLVEAAGGPKEAFQMSMLDHIDHLADTGAKAISNIKFDKVVVWDNGNSGGDGGGNATANFLKGLATALPPTMHLMKDIGGVDLPKYFGSLVDSDESLKSYPHKLVSPPASSSTPSTTTTTTSTTSTPSPTNNSNNKNTNNKTK